MRATRKGNDRSLTTICKNDGRRRHNGKGDRESKGGDNTVDHGMQRAEVDLREEAG